MLHDGARQIVETLRAHDHQAYWAGGCVRDRLLGRSPKDIDVATSARPDAIMALFPHTKAFGKAFGVIAVSHLGHTYEVTTFRRESDYTDGRHPCSVSFTDAREDAQRRDFTINALFYDPLTDEVLDYVGGQADLDAHVIRAVGHADDRFEEDHLRMLRAIRFAGRLDFQLEPTTARAIYNHAPQLTRISVERIRDELVRMLTESVRPGDTLRLARECGLLAVVLPEVEALAGVAQPPAFHPEGDVFTHTQLMLNRMQDPSPELAFAVLLHDIGKPATARIGPSADGSERIRFDGHDKVGAECAERILKRLRFSNAFIRDVTHCVRNHMRFMHVQEMRTAKLRALVHAPTYPIERELHRLDCEASHGQLDNYHFLSRFEATLEDEPELPAPWIRGDDVMALGVPEGQAVGFWLKQAYQRQLNDEAADRDALLAWLRREIKDNNGRPPSG